jgi:hypothetical protein
MIAGAISDQRAATSTQDDQQDQPKDTPSDRSATLDEEGRRLFASLSSAKASGRVPRTQVHDPTSAPARSGRRTRKMNAKHAAATMRAIVVTSCRATSTPPIKLGWYRERNRNERRNSSR